MPKAEVLNLKLKSTDCIDHPLLYNLRQMINNSHITCYDIRNFYIKCYGYDEEYAIKKTNNMITSIKHRNDLKIDTIEDWINICGYDLIFEKDE